MYEKLYNGRMGGDLYRLQRGRGSSDAMPMQSGLPKPALPAPPPPAPERKSLAELLPKSITEIADNDDLLILGIMLLLLREKSDMDLIGALAMILLK